MIRQTRTGAKRVAMTAVLAVVAMLCRAQEMSGYLFKTIDASNGLTSSQINSIVKDERGYVWFGTPAGLYRYDGYVFKHFQTNSQDGASLPDSYIDNIQELSEGTLWVKTSAGYCIYDPQNEIFERNVKQKLARYGFKDVPRLLYIDRYKNIWGYLPKEGIACYNAQQQLMVEFDYSTRFNGIPKGEICSISECKDGVILVYRDGRIVCCDVMHGQNVIWNNSEIAQRQLRNTPTLKVFVDQNDNIWLYGQGTLFVMNKQAKTWNTQIGDALGLIGIGVDFTINGMAGDRNGNIWIATSRGGLMRTSVNNYTMESVMLRTMNVQRSLFNTKSIQSVYVDDTDLLWVGTSKSGVAYWGANIYKFDVKSIGDITAIMQDGNGKVWYGTSDNGIYGYEGKLASLNVTALATTPDGSIWVGSKQNGLTRIKDGQTRIYATTVDTLRRTVIDDHIKALVTDKHGNLWIASEGGLQMFNLKLETFSNYTKETGKLRVNSVTSLCYTRNHRILAGTSEGLMVLNIADGQIRHLTGNSTNMAKFTNNYVTYVYQDSRGLIWIGTREGVNVLNEDDDRLDYITERQNLCNNNVCAIAEDKSHNIWITTSNGVSRVVLQRDHEQSTFHYGLYNYTKEDGLQSNEFNLGAICTLRDSTVQMGGLYGVNWIREKSQDEADYLPKVILTQLYIGEEEIQVGRDYDGNIVLPCALNELNKLQLKSGQNTFTIKFAAGNYNQSERLQFEYLLEKGGKGVWRNGDAMTHGVTFTNLKSGHYKLHVKARAAGMGQSKEDRIIEIIVERPFYLQYWMIIIYVFLALLLFYIWKIGIDQLRQLWNAKKEILNYLAAQRDEIKAASDDLRQPMARMTSIIMNLAESGKSPEEREQLNALHSQMLQVITRVSDMQLALEHPEQTAKKNLQRHYEIDSNGEMKLPETISEELTSELRQQQAASPTSKFKVVFIDDGEDFMRFVNARLKYVYDFHPYNDVITALHDIEAMMPDLVVCKHEMPNMSGSELCVRIKTHPAMHRIKFVLMTETKLSQKELANQDITMSADYYLAKPFNIQEAAMHFNQLLGIETVNVSDDLIEGAETRLLEDRTSSMTTATESMDYGDYDKTQDDDDDELMKAVAVTVVDSRRDSLAVTDTPDDDDSFTMTSTMDRQLLNSIEQYVQQNMSRGQINIDEMAQAMGMALRPFFQRVLAVTGKTPAELVRDVKLKHACILLKRTNINMSELASNVGFMTGENFINVFKERFGISPSEYRQQYRVK